MHRIFTLAGNIAIKKRKNAFSRLEYVYVTTALNNASFYRLLLSTRKFSPPTGGFFLAPAEG